jgi:phage protein D
MWERAKLAAFQRAIAAAEKWKPMIAHLQELAKHVPAFKQRVDDLEVMRQTAENVGKLAVAIDPQGK